MDGHSRPVSEAVYTQIYFCCDVFLTTENSYAIITPYSKFFCSLFDGCLNFIASAEISFWYQMYSENGFCFFYRHHISQTLFGIVLFFVKIIKNQL